MTLCRTMPNDTTFVKDDVHCVIRVSEGDR